MKTFEQVYSTFIMNSALTWLKTDKCVIPASELTSKVHSIPFYIDLTPSVLEERLQGIWWHPSGKTSFNDLNNIDSLSGKQLINSCINQDIIINWFEKYLKWKDKIYMPIEFIYLTFSDGLFYKFPTVFSKSATSDWVENRPVGCGYPNSQPTIYEPRCRPYYTGAYESRDEITITEPYKFVTGQYGNDICVKSHARKRVTNSLNEQWEWPEVLICFAFNFFDYNIFKDQISLILESTKLRLFLVYVDETKRTLKVVFNSWYFPEELKCNVESTNYSCEPINFFDIYYKDLLDSLYTSIQTIHAGNSQWIELLYITEYNNWLSFFQENIKIKIDNVLAEDPEILWEINWDNWNQQDTLRFSFVLQKEPILNTKTWTFEFKESKYDETFYVLPLIPGFSYTYNNNEYELIQSGKYNYYIITCESSESLDTASSNFNIVAIWESFLFLFYILWWNILIWFLCSIIYYFIYNGIFLPWKSLCKLHTRLYKLAIAAKRGEIEEGYSNHKWKLYTRQDIINKMDKKKREADNWIDLVFNLKSIVCLNLNYCFNWENNNDLSKALLTWEAIKTIIEFSDTNTHWTNVTGNWYEVFLNNNPTVNDFTKALEYFTKTAFERKSNRDNIDYLLLKWNSERLFNAIVSKKTVPQKNIMEYYWYFRNKIFKTQNELKALMRKNKLNKEIKKDLNILIKLDLNIQYSYAMSYSEYLDNTYNNSEQAENDFRIDIYDIDEYENDFINWDKKDRLKVSKTTQELKFQNRFPRGYEKEINDKGWIELWENYKNKNQIKEEEYYMYTELCFLEQGISNDNHIILEDRLKREKRVLQLINLLKSISILITLSKLYIVTNDHSKCLSVFEDILYSIHLFEDYCFNQLKNNKTIQPRKTSAFKDKTSQPTIQKIEYKTNKTAFISLIIETLLYEKVIYNWSLIQQKYRQTKNYLFIHVNLLDLGPVSNKVIYKKIVNEWTIYLHNQHWTYLSLHKPKNQSKIQIDDLVTWLKERYYIDYKKGIYAWNYLRDAHNVNRCPNYCRNNKEILFLFDTNNAFLHDEIFKAIFFKYFSKYNQFANWNFRYAAFDTHLYVMDEMNLNMFKSKKIPYSNHYIYQLPIDWSFKYQKDLTKKDIEIKTAEAFFEFMWKRHLEHDEQNKSTVLLGTSDKSGSKGNKTQIIGDKAIYHAALTGFTEEHNHDWLCSKYWIWFTNLDTYFSDSFEKWERISEIVYHKKICLILIIMSNDNWWNTEEMNVKVGNIKKYIYTLFVNAHWFVIKNSEMWKMVFTVFFPIKVNIFDSRILYNLLNSLEAIKKGKVTKIKG